ncbi:MAG: metallophosphoesterase [Firmicutes bacterium]|nr:metallophosphoesterase [Bacillota bacterium]
MKIFAISDLHLGNDVEKPMNVFGQNWDGYVEKIKKSWNANIKKGDVGIIAGDLSWAMRMEQAKADLDFLKELNGTKIIIRGNHDYWWSTISKVRAALPEDCYALQNDCVKIKNIIFCGTRGWKVAEPWQKNAPADEKILQSEYHRLRLSLEAAKAAKTKKRDKIVCIVHFPPFNSKREDSQFTKIIEEYKPNCVVYGHLHGKNARVDLVIEKNGIKYYLTSCDLVGHEVVKLHI